MPGVGGVGGCSTVSVGKLSMLVMRPRANSRGAILIAVVWLKEPFTRLRILAVLLAAAAVPLLRLA